MSEEISDLGRQLIDVAGRTRTRIVPEPPATNQAMNELLMRAAGRGQAAPEPGAAGGVVTLPPEEGDDRVTARAKALGCIDIDLLRLVLPDGVDELRGAALTDALGRIARERPFLFGSPENFERRAAETMPVGLHGGARGGASVEPEPLTMGDMIVGAANHARAQREGYQRAAYEDRVREQALRARDDRLSRG